MAESFSNEEDEGGGGGGRASVMSHQQQRGARGVRMGPEASYATHAHGPAVLTIAV